MAKAKQGVDIKALALAHIEKVVLAVIVFCFLSLIWQAFRLQGMPEGHDPKAIESAAAAADSQIGSTTYIEYTQGPVVPRFDSTVMDELDGETYASPVPMNPTLETRRDRRFDPALVTAQDPEIHIDYGPFALLTAKSIERELAMQSIAAPRWLQEQMSRARRVESDLTRAQKQLPLPGVDVSDRTVAEGRRWVMVNALVPHSRQQSEYNKVFLKYDGFDAENDRPRYLGYEAQRAKVSGGEQGEWETVFRQSPTSRSMEIITFRWGKRGKLEIIDPRYVVESVTWPLGPRVLADWGERDQHSQVPLKKKEESKGEPGNEGFDPILNPNAKRQRFEEQEEKDVPHRMLRYFDFDVQPGERYRYRFRLILRDPNYIRDASYEEQAYGKHKRVAIKYLDKKVVQRIEEKKARLKAQGLSEAEIEAEMRLIYSDWSEPTETVKIPFDTRILAIDTEPALLYSPRSEPS